MNKLIDIHSHILPNLDDGADGIEQAVEMCRIAVENGVSDIIATPHFFHPMFEVEYKTAKEKFTELEKKVRDNDLNITIHLGFECRIHGNLIDQVIESPEFSLCGNGKFFLLELDSLFVPPPDFDSFIFEARSKGLQPILVHPERYYRSLKGTSLLEEFVEKGLQIQVTAGAITGLQGKQVRQFTQKLLKADIIHYVASDFHSIESGYELANAYGKVKQLQGKETADKLFISNPHKVLGESR